MNHFVAKEISGAQGCLSAEESHHALRVLRLSAGLEISVTIGDGKVYRASLSGCTTKEVYFEIKELLREEKRPQLKIAIAPTKSNDRFEFFLEKATELGIAEITPLLCQHSERKIYKEQRGEKIILSAVKQSKKGYLPRLNPLTKFKDFLQAAGPEPVYMAHLENGDHIPLHKVDFTQSCWIMIGPEGDFSHAEIEQAKGQGCKTISLGKEVLRTETAGIFVAAASALQVLR